MLAEGALLVFDGASWISTTPAALRQLTRIGIGTSADAANPSAATLNAALWTAITAAEGNTGDLFYTMNKETAADNLGMTLQSGFATKALLGLFGSDRFRLAVSADGGAFCDAPIADSATGIVDQPRLKASAYDDNDNDNDNDVGVWTRTKIAVNSTDANDKGAVDAAHVSLATALRLQTMAPLAAGDTVELQAFRTADGYVAAEQTSFRGRKIG